MIEFGEIFFICFKLLNKFFFHLMIEFDETTFCLICYLLHDVVYFFDMMIKSNEMAFYLICIALHDKLYFFSYDDLTRWNIYKSLFDQGETNHLLLLLSEFSVEGEINRLLQFFILDLINKNTSIFQRVIYHFFDKGEINRLL